MKKGKKRFCIIFNLNGLHDRVYSSRGWSVDGGWDIAGDVKVLEQHRDGYHCFVFESRRKANEVLAILKTYRLHISKHL